MKTYTWTASSVAAGLTLTTDPKLGPVVFLGEEGRGRHYEKIALDRHRPAVVEGGRVLDAHPRKVTLPPKDGKAEKVFYVLERPQPGTPADKAVLVRIDTGTGYVRNAAGRWTAAAGKPEELISGHGAFGDAGRVGGWKDSLVVMRPGDVIRVYPTTAVGGVAAFALWVDESGTPKTAPWHQYETLQAVAKATSSDALMLVTGSVQCATYKGGGTIENGIAVKDGPNGPAIVLGERGRGRNLFEVPFVGLTPGSNEVWEAAVAELSRQEVPARYSWEQPTTKVVYGLTESAEVDETTWLVRLNPTSSPHRTTYEAKVVAGAPVQIARGNFASGDAGAAGYADDALYVIRPGDAVRIGGWVVENVSGKLTTTLFGDWELAKATQNPEAFVAAGRAPVQHTPAEWVGRVVEVVYRRTESYRGNTVVNWPKGDPAELVSINPLVVNTGWDGRDRTLVTLSSDAAWIELDHNRVVRVLEGAELDERNAAKVEHEVLRREAGELVKAKHFAYIGDHLVRRTVGQVAEGRHVSKYTADTNDLAVGSADADTIRTWNAMAREALDEAKKAEAEARELAERVGRGEILVGWTVWQRFGGATNRGAAWVIRPDGSCREHDARNCERRSNDGDYTWNRVEANELAIAWSKAYTAADHVFTVAKRPVNGLTPAQLGTVERLEREIAEEFDSSRGVSGSESPSIGAGWGLKPTPAAKLSTPAPTTSAKLASDNEVSAALNALRDKFGNRR